MRRLAAVPLVALLALSCQDVPLPTDVHPPPQLEIMDAAHNDGRVGFYFGYPVGFPDSMGIFDPSVLPFLAVEICEWNGLECVLPLLERMTSETSEHGAALIRIKNDSSAYHTRWDTWNYDVEAGLTYRIRVLASGVHLGHFDVILTEDRSGFKDVDRNEYVALVEDGRLPIIFRVESGSVGLNTVLDRLNDQFVHRLLLRLEPAVENAIRALLTGVEQEILEGDLVQAVELLHNANELAAAAVTPTVEIAFLDLIFGFYEQLLIDITS